jgi:hypothetical protein
MAFDRFKNVSTLFQGFIIFVAWKPKNHNRN